MNITQLFVNARSSAQLTHVGNASSRVTRTAEELASHVAATSEAFAALDVRSGDAVLILGSARVEILEAILASFNTGAVAVPVSPLLGTTHICSIIQRMRPACCVFEDVPEQGILDALADCASRLIAIKSSKSIPGCHLYRDLADRHRASLTLRTHALDHPALVMHGSGSSGRLKAIVMSHERLFTYCEYNRLVFAQYTDSPETPAASAPTLTSLPLAHLAGLGNTLLSLMNGQRTFLMSSFLPDVYLRLVEEIRCSNILLVPSLYRRLLKEPYLRDMDKSALRFCIIGGEPSPDELLAQIEEAFGAQVVTAYGMTECLCGIGHIRRDLRVGVKRGSCGKQFFGELSLRDAQGHEQAQTGELWVRNASVHACYQDPASNAERLRDGWFRTGDLFFRDADGNYFHRGRADDMFICNGKNIYPIEIERLLLGHPAVTMACAAAVTLPDKGTVPAAMVVAGAPVSEAELQQLCLLRGPSHAVPQLIRFVDALPLVGPGKIDRRTVQHLLACSVQSCK